MNTTRFQAIAALLLLAAPVLSGGCQAGPTKASTYYAVDEHFQLENVPYSIRFGTPQKWGEIRAWPIEVYPLDFREEFSKKYPGQYLVYREPDGDWVVIEKEMLREKIKVEKIRAGTP